MCPFTISVDLPDAPCSVLIREQFGEVKLFCGMTVVGRAYWDQRLAMTVRRAGDVAWHEWDLVDAAVRRQVASDPAEAGRVLAWTPRVNWPVVWAILKGLAVILAVLAAVVAIAVATSGMSDRGSVE